MNPFFCERLTVHYEKTLCLWNVSFATPAGQLIGIIGPNGAGKSSFIKAVMGLLSPTDGQVLFWGRPLEEVSEKIAYIPQKESIDENFPITVADVVLMGRYHKMGFWKRARKADLLSAEESLEQVGMIAYKDRQIGELSGGQQKRVFLARALVQEADLYFLDEPFQGVDAETETTIMSILQDLAAQGKTIFVVHHDLHTVKRYFQSLLLLNTSLVGFGPYEEVFTEENLKRLYKKNPFLFEEATALCQKNYEGARL